MRKRGRIDVNQNEIVAALRKIGARVRSLANIGDGMPDLLCCFRGQLYLLEVKSGNEKLTPAEETFRAEWQCVEIVRSVDEALQAVGAMKK